MTTALDLTLSKLTDVLALHAAIRRVRRLQPVGGTGDKIFPPTYPAERQNAPPRHVFERRRVDGRDAWCVLVDSVQSQANRLEEALLTATDGDRLPLPYVTVDFSGAGLEPLKRITSLDAPHRVYDAILRDSLLDRDSFMQTDQGRRLAAAKPEDATALLELSPTALLFGAWHSQGEGGGLGAKFPRALVSEIMAINTPVDDQQPSEAAPRTSGRRTGSRIDPLGIQKSIKIYRSAQNEHDWTPNESEAARNRNNVLIEFSRKKGDKKGKPSVINHGNVTPTVEPLGVTCDYIEHRAVITLAGLRRLRFGDDDRNTAARALLVALGLLALAEQDANGYALRSRCDLVCEGSAPLEVVRADGSTETLEQNRAQARSLYKEAYAQAESVGFGFESLTLRPQDKLIEIVRRSRDLALAGAGGDADDEQ